MQNQEWICSEAKYPKQVCFIFPTAKYLSAVRENAIKIAERMGFREEDVFDISLATDEAYVNAVEHGADKPGVEVKVTFSIYEDRLEVEVADTGKGFPIEDFEISEDFNSIRSVRGRGLALIKILTDDMLIDSVVGKGTTIAFVKYIESRVESL